LVLSPTSIGINKTGDKSIYSQQEITSLRVDSKLFIYEPG